MNALSKSAHRLLFFQIEVDQTVSRTLERVVCGVRPHRVFSSVEGEEDFGDVLNIHCAFGIITFARRVGCHSKRVVNIRFHRVDQVELNDLVTTDRCANIVFNDKFALRIIDDDIILTLLTKPHIQRRLNDGLTFTCAGNSQNHRIDGCRIYDISTGRTLRLVQRKLPVVVDQIGNSFIAAELITVLTIRIIRNLRSVIADTDIGRRARCLEQSIRKLFIDHGYLLCNRIAILIAKDLTLVIHDVPIIVFHIFFRTLGKHDLFQTLIAESHMGNHA